MKKTSKIMVRLFAVVSAIIMMASYASLAFAVAEEVRTEAEAIEFAFENKTSDILGFESDGYQITVKNYANNISRNLTATIVVADEAKDTVGIGDIDGLKNWQYDLRNSFSSEYLDGKTISVSISRDWSTLIVGLIIVVVLIAMVFVRIIIL